MEPCYWNGEACQLGETAHPRTASLSWASCLQRDPVEASPSEGFSFRCSSCSWTAATQLEWMSSASLFRSAIDLSTSSESLAMASSLGREDHGGGGTRQRQTPCQPNGADLH